MTRRAELERRPARKRRLPRQFLSHSSAIQLLVEQSSGAIVDASPAACEFYGYRHAELTAKRIFDIDVAAPERVVATLGTAISEMRSVFACQHLLASGEVRDVEVHSGPLEIGGTSLLYQIVHDVTEHKRAHSALMRHLAALRAAMDGMAILGADERYVFVNEAHAQIYGYECPDELLGCTWRELYDKAEAARIEGVAFATLRREGRWRGEAVGRRRDGSFFDQEISLTALPDGGLVCVVRDTSRRKRAERLQSALFRINAMALSAADTDALYAGVHAIVGDLLYAKNFYIALHDAEADLLTFPYFVDESDTQPQPQPAGRSLTGYVLRTGQPLLADPETYARLVQEEGLAQIGTNSIDWLGAPLMRGDTAFGAVVVQSYSPATRFSAADLELLTFVSQHLSAAIDRKRGAEALRESEARFRTLAQTAPCAILIFRDDRFVYVNDACLEISGRSREDFMRLAPWELAAPEFRDLLRNRGQQRQDGQPAPARYEFRLLRPDGEERWVDFSAGLIEYEGRTAVLGTAFDITERKRSEEQIRSLAYHDPLTSLPNRLLCHDRLFMAVAQAHRLNQRLAVLFLDVDRFKAINDSLGHLQGDRLLRAVAERLRGIVREGDTVSRLGGDEFVMVLPGITRAVDAVRVAEKVREALQQPFDLAGHELRVTASMGISLYPADGADAETLIKNADTAMYRAKEQGRDGYQLYAPAMKATALERLALEQSLRHALARNELELHYQPVLDIPSGRVVEVEALLRWRRPRGFVSPSEFIPLAEITGLISTLGPWALESACTQARKWQNHMPGLRVALNLSARQIQQADLVEQTDAVLRRTGLEPRLLSFDVTEAATAQCGDMGVETLRRLRGLGVGLALDDFGAGTASLQGLRRLPLDTIKLDAGLVRSAASDPDQAALVAAIIRLAHALRLPVVAEAVETEEQLALLAEHGCDRMQGHLFAAALPPADLEELLDKLSQDVRLEPPVDEPPRRQR